MEKLRSALMQIDEIAVKIKNQESEYYWCTIQRADPQMTIDACMYWPCL